jgi:glycosyltransferase involved in cell wall biosynthesis
MSLNFNVVMVGPDPSGMGGISRVVNNWKRSNFFLANRIYYVSTVNENIKNKVLFLLKAFIQFINICISQSNTIVYIHTASFNSFYRKMLFLSVSVALKKKIILHIHPSYFFNFISSFRTFKREFFFTLLRHVSIFIVLTDEMKNNMSSLFPQIPIHVLHNPVDISAMKPPICIKREANRFLFLGWFNRGKGVYDLADAAALIEDEGIEFFLDFFGTKEVEQLREYILKKGLSKNVKVHGWAIDEQKIIALYRSAALILPSYTEGIPNVILEAMATKTPIISTQVGGLMEVIKDGKNAIVVNPKDPKDLAEKIKFVLDNKALCAELAAKAYIDAVQKYDVPVITDRLESILLSIRD